MTSGDWYFHLMNILKFLSHPRMISESTSLVHTRRNHVHTTFLKFELFLRLYERERDVTRAALIIKFYFKGFWSIKKYSCITYKIRAEFKQIWNIISLKENVLKDKAWKKRLRSDISYRNLVCCTRETKNPLWINLNVKSRREDEKGKTNS